VFWLSDRSELAVIGRSLGPLVEKARVYAVLGPQPHEARPVLDKSHGSSGRLPPRGGDGDPELSAPIRIYSPRQHRSARRVSEPHLRRRHVAFGNPPVGGYHLRPGGLVRAHTGATSRITQIRQAPLRSDRIIVYRRPGRIHGRDGGATFPSVGLDPCSVLCAEQLVHLNPNPIGWHGVRCMTHAHSLASRLERSFRAIPVDGGIHVNLWKSA